MLGNLFVRSFPRSAWERKMSTLRVEDAPVGECFEGRVQWSPRSGWVVRSHAERGNEARQAISLTEVLIAMGILTLGLLGVAAIFPVGSFGHTGFTGVTMWIDPGSGTYVIVLANVIHQRGGPPVVTLSGDVATETARALGLYGS